MKIINAKGLIRFAASASHPDRAGFLQKRGDVNKGFQKRWFVLRGNLLFYFEKKDDKEPLGVIVLEGCTIEIAGCENLDSHAFQISFPGSTTRTYILSASSQEDLETWMRALSCAPYDFAKLVVADLEQQLYAAMVDNAKLVQAAERESRILSHAYNEEGAVKKVCRHPDPTEQDKVDLLGDFGFVSENSDVGTRPARQNPFCNTNGDDIDCSTSSLDVHSNRTSSASLPSHVTTWKMLGISNFYEMHDEVKRQIKEFRFSHIQ